MICYGVWSFFHEREDDEEAAEVEKRLVAKAPLSMASVFFSAVGLLVVLDLAGDATEVLTILFVARFGDALLVFVAAVIALVAATAIETTIGSRLSRVLSVNRLRIFSTLVFVTIGTIAILSVILHM
jgi:putative Ca2+/H+ antiporter (TMEM165/GDT1 family)